MHIFITGGTKGIGNGVVKAFLQHGHKVTFTGTSLASIDKAMPFGLPMWISSFFHFYSITHIL